MSDTTRATDVPLTPWPVEQCINTLRDQIDRNRNAEGTRSRRAFGAYAAALYRGETYQAIAGGGVVPKPYHRPIEPGKPTLRSLGVRQ